MQEEIGEVFDKWSSNASVCTSTPTTIKESNTKWRSEDEELTPPFNHKKLPAFETTTRTDHNAARKEDLSSFKSYSLPSRRESRNFEKYLDLWSKSLLAEFDSLTQDENYQRSQCNVDSADDDYDEVAEEDDWSDEESSSFENMKYRINKEDNFRISPTVSPSTSEHSSSGSSANDNKKTPPYISRIMKSKQHSQVASINNKRDPVLVNVKIYPTEQIKTPEIRKIDYRFQNGQHVSFFFFC